jgi:hypothetical protein
VRFAPLKIKPRPRAHENSACVRQTPAQRAASYARGLLNQSRQPSAEARGAAEARALLGYQGGTVRVERARPAKFDKFGVFAGAYEARKLLKGR